MVQRDCRVPLLWLVRFRRRVEEELHVSSLVCGHEDRRLDVLLLWIDNHGVCSSLPLQVSPGPNKFFLRSKFGSSDNTNSIPVFTKKQSRRKRDSLESFTDMSLSQSSEMKEKSFNGASSFGAFSFADVGGALEENNKDIPESPSTSSVSHDTVIPHPHPSEQLDIEISSIRHSLIVPPPTHDPKSPHEMV